MDTIMNSSDESFLRWRFSLEEENNIMEEEECEEEPLLKTVVRTNYLYHLRQSLRKNLEAMKQTNDCVEDNSINKVIKGCSALLEEKALRNCMIARLYQRMMTKIIKDVKKATNDGSIYLPLKQFAEHQSKSTTLSTFLNKEVQTDIMMEFLPKLLTDFRKQTQTVQLDDNSDEFKPSIQLMNGTENLRCPNRSRKLSSVREDELSHKFTNVDGLNSQECEPNLNSKLSYKQNKEERIIKAESVEGDNQKVFPDTSQSYSANKHDDFQAKLKSATFVEAISYWYYVENEIADMPSKKRKKLDERFTQLFGKDHNIDYYFLTDEQKSLTCRKRIAKYVVIELTNYYNKRKIASKELFKTLAKHITSLLLGRSLYQSPDEIKKSVEEFFYNGRVIRTEDDFYI